MTSSVTQGWIPQPDDLILQCALHVDVTAPADPLVLAVHVHNDLAGLAGCCCCLSTSLCHLPVARPAQPPCVSCSILHALPLWVNRLLLLLHKSCCCVTNTLLHTSPTTAAQVLPMCQATPDVHNSRLRLHSCLAIASLPAHMHTYTHQREGLKEWDELAFDFRKQRFVYSEEQHAFCKLAYPTKVRRSTPHCRRTRSCEPVASIRIPYSNAPFILPDPFTARWGCTAHAAEWCHRLTCRGHLAPLPTLDRAASKPVLAGPALAQAMLAWWPFGLLPGPCAVRTLEAPRLYVQLPPQPCRQAVQGTGRQGAGGQGAGRQAGRRHGAGRQDVDMVQVGKVQAGKAQAGKQGAGRQGTDMAQAGKAQAGRAQAGRAQTWRRPASTACCGRAHALLRAWPGGGAQSASKRSSVSTHAPKAPSGSARAHALRAALPTAAAGDVWDIHEGHGPRHSRQVPGSARQVRPEHVRGAGAAVPGAAPRPPGGALLLLPGGVRTAVPLPCSRASPRASSHSVSA